MEKKTCRDCGETKPTDDYYTNVKRRPDGSVRNNYVLPYCKVCWRLRAKIHRDNATPEQREKYNRRHKTPEAYRRANLKRQYGITPEQYDEMSAAQEGTCALCNEPPPEGKYLSVDHDHQTERLRMLLCQLCNSMLGYARDRVDVLEAGAAYLRKHQ